MVNCTIVLPVYNKTPIWWPFVMENCVSHVNLAKKGDIRVLRLPSKKGFLNDTTGLKVNLDVFRLNFD